MRFLLTLTMICVLFSVSYAQNKTTHAIGKDNDGDMWYIDTALVVQPRPPADWIRVMPIYTLLPGRALIFYFNVDCSDGTYQFYKAQSIDANGKILFEREDPSRWSKFTGYSGAGARMACRVTPKRMEAVINE